MLHSPTYNTDNATKAITAMTFIVMVYLINTILVSSVGQRCHSKSIDKHEP